MEPETGGVRNVGQRSGNILKSRLNSGTNLSHTFKKKQQKMKQFVDETECSKNLET